MEKRNIFFIKVENYKFSVDSDELIVNVITQAIQTFKLKFSSSEKIIYLSFEGIILDSNKNLLFYGFSKTTEKSFKLIESTEQISFSYDPIIQTYITKNKEIIFSELFSENQSIYMIKKKLEETCKFQQGAFQLLNQNNEILENYITMKKLKENENSNTIFLEMKYYENITLKIFQNNNSFVLLKEIPINLEFGYVINHWLNITNFQIMTESEIIKNETKIIEKIENLDLYFEFYLLENTSQKLVFKFFYDNNMKLVFCDKNDLIKKIFHRLSKSFKFSGIEKISNLIYEDKIIDKEKTWMDLNIKSFSEIKITIIEIYNLNDSFSPQTNKIEAINLKVIYFTKKGRNIEIVNIKKDDLLSKLLFTLEKKIGIEAKYQKWISINRLENKLTEINYNEIDKIDFLGLNDIELLVTNKNPYTINIAYTIFEDKTINFQYSLDKKVDSLRIKILKLINFENLSKDSFKLSYESEIIKTHYIFDLNLKINESNNFNFDLKFINRTKVNIQIKDFENTSNNQEIQLNVSPFLTIEELKNESINFVKMNDQIWLAEKNKNEKIIMRNKKYISDYNYKEKHLNIEIMKKYKFLLIYNNVNQTIETHLDKLIKIFIQENLEILKIPIDNEITIFYNKEKLLNSQKLCDYPGFFNENINKLVFKKIIIKNVMIKISENKTLNKEFESEMKIKKIVEIIRNELLIKEQIKLDLFLENEKINLDLSLDYFKTNQIVFQLIQSMDASFYDQKNNSKKIEINLNLSDNFKKIKRKICKDLNIPENLLILLDDKKKQINSMNDFFDSLPNTEFKIEYLIEIIIKTKNNKIINLEFPLFSSLKNLIKRINDQIQNIFNEETDNILLLNKKNNISKVCELNDNINEYIVESNIFELEFIIKKIKNISLFINDEIKINNFVGYEMTDLKTHKLILEKKIDFLAERQIWYFCGKEMDDNNKVLEDFEIDKKISQEIIFVYTILNLNLFINNEKFEIRVKANEKIIELKNRFKEQIKFLPSEQIWLYDGKELKDNYTIKENKLNLKENLLSIDVIIQNDLQYLGFNEKINKLDVNCYNELFIETPESITNIIQNINLQNININDEKDSMIFKSKILPIIFNDVKKHTKWENTITIIKEEFYKIHGLKIWTPKENSSFNTFNSTFLLYYLLNSENKNLIDLIIKSMKNYSPIPLYLKEWVSINNITNLITKFQNLFWHFNKGFIITSIGVNANIKGKSSLMNKIFSTCFGLKEERHIICQGVPEIYFDIYKNKRYPIHIIDIPSKFDNKKEILNILNLSNLIIVHGNSKNEIQNFLINIPKKCSFIPIIRDYDKFEIPNSDINSFSFVPQIYIPNITNLNNVEYEYDIKHLSQFCNNYVLKIFKETENNINFYNFLEFYENNKKFIPLLKSMESLDHNEKIFKKKDHLLNQTIINIFSEYLYDSESKEFEISRFDKISENMKIFNEKKYHNFGFLIDYQKNFEKNDDEILEEEKIKFNKYWEILCGDHKEMKRIKAFKNKNSIDEIREKINEAINIFQNKIKPSIFSLELLWREIINYSKKDPSFEIKLDKKPVLFNKILIEIMRSLIINSHPFEIIDGDDLTIQIEFYKNVLRGFDKKVIVISIIGPQSSGKSTLLNFLFGCDFVTSEGRCTKGIYGTYFPISNLSNCDGIIVLDTEGLFSILNKQENENRKDIDRKLSLFCFAVSNFVIINSKGDISQTTKDVINICLNSLFFLKRGNDISAELIICLNQNNEGIKNHQQELNNLFDDFNLSNNLKDEKIQFNQIKKDVSILPYAFTHEDTKEFKGVSDEIIKFEKKNPKANFLKECQIMLKKLTEKFKNLRKGYLKTLEGFFDNMDLIWKTINAFENLVNIANVSNFKEYQEMEDWLSKKKLGMEKEVNKIYDSVTNLNLSDKEKGLSILQEALFNFKKNTSDDFLKKFSNFKEKNNFHESELEKTLNKLINDCKINFNNYLIRNKFATALLNGDENINILINEIKSNDISDENTKKEMFEKKWQSQLEIMKDKINKTELSNNLYEEILNYYKNCMSGFKLTLPKIKWIDNKKQFNLKNLNSQWFNDFVKLSISNDEIFEFNQNVDGITDVFKGVIKNIKFIYFDLRKFYKDKKIEQYHYIDRKKLKNIIKFHQIEEESNLILKEKKEFLINELYKSVSDSFASFFISLDRDCFFQKFESKISNFTLFLKTIRLTFQSNFFEKAINFSSKLQACSQRDFIYLNLPIINSLIIDYKNNYISYLSLKQSIFLSGINWFELEQSYKSKLKNFSSELRIEKILDDLNKELKNFNLYVNMNKSLFYSKIMEDPYIFEIFVCENVNNLSDIIKDINKVNCNYKYIDISQYNYCKYTRNHYFPDKDQILIYNEDISIKTLIDKKYEKIEWLKYYGQEIKNDYLMKDTYEINDLKNFVLDEFNFKLFYEKILESINDYLKLKNSLNYHITIPDIFTIVNDIISDGNNDLQQINYRFTLLYTSYIHLIAIHLIWNHFDEINWRQKNEVIDNYIKNKNDQLNYFLIATSNDQNRKNKKECSNLVKNLEEEIIKYKLDLKENLKKEIIINFKLKMPRSKVQEKIDSLYYSINSNKSLNEVYEYVTNPEIVLKKYYNELYLGELDKWKLGIKQDNSIISILNCISERVSILNNKLTIIFNEANCSLDSIFYFSQSKEEISSKIENTDLPIIKYNDELSSFLFNYFIKLIVEGKNEESWKKCSKSISASLSKSFLEINFNLDPLKIPNELIKCLVSNNNNRKMYNPIQFLKRFNHKIKKINKKNYEENITQDEENLFLEEITIHICKQKCPCCDRLCGLTENVHTYHQCLYGHQIRAIGGMILNNNEASITRCEDLGEFNIVQYNNVAKTWIDFKKDFERAAIPWKFDDLKETKDNKLLKDKFELAWSLVGEKICKELYNNINMQYVPFNQSNIENQLMINPIHYIFMIDSSS